MRVEALRLAEAFRARVVDATTESFIFELTGAPDKIDSFVALMRELGNKSGGLPYTVILDAKGKPVRQFLGLLDEKALSKTLAGL